MNNLQSDEQLLEKLIIVGFYIKNLTQYYLCYKVGKF